MKKGFTLIELLVVIAMIMLLVGSVSSALMSARNRAKIAKATTTCQEMTNAILAYENYRSLDEEANGQWKPTTEGNIGFLLGQGKTKDGEDIPVLFNAAIEKAGGTKGVLDPWGRPYMYKIARKSKSIKATGTSTLRTSVFFPNYNRRRAGEKD